MLENNSDESYKKKPISPQKLTILNTMDEIHIEDLVYGVRRIRDALIRKDFHINRPTVALYVKELGLETIYQKLNTAQSCPQNKSIPVSLAERKSVLPESYLGNGYNLHPDAMQIHVSGSLFGLILKV